MIIDLPKRNKYLFRKLLTLLAVIIFGCDTEELTISDDAANLAARQEKILGTWISTDKSDTLDLIDNNSFYRSNNEMHHDHYDYKLFIDSIEVRYRGVIFIGISPTRHKYLFDDNILTIDFSNKNCYGFDLTKISYEVFH